MTMKQKLIYFALLFALVSLGSCSVSEVEPQTQPEEQPYAQNELLVKFTPEVVSLLEKAQATRSGVVTRSGEYSVDQVLEIIGTAQIERIFPVDNAREDVTRNSGLHRWYRVAFEGKYSVEEVAKRFAALGEVQSVDFNRKVKRAYNHKAIPLSKSDLERAESQRTRAAMSDPLLSKQWYLINDGTMFTEGEIIKSVKDADVQCEAAWKLSTGNESVVVAVLDEGIFIEHPDLQSAIWNNEDEIYRSDKDNDNNGYVGDAHGYNFAKKSGVITWDNIYDSGHGSHVAGVIAADNNNGIGMSSIAGGNGSRAGVKIMVCQIFSGNVGTDAIGVARAIKYAADNGAVVLQCSWGYVSGAANSFDWGAPGFATQEEWEAGTPLEKDALDYFTHNAGSPNGPIDGGIAVFAAGNENAAMAGYPGACDEYISVAATAADFTPAVYTNYGPGTSISAPGGDQDYYYEYISEDNEYGAEGCILSALPYHVSESGYGYMEGTSMACPNVSAVVALGISYATDLRRHFKAEELRELLLQTAIPFDQYLTGKKVYRRYVIDIGPQQPMSINMSDYRGKMGSGQVNAAGFLNAIAGAGTQMRFPNIYVGVNGSQQVAPSIYFVSGESLTYQVSIADSTIATCEMQGSKLIFKGLKQGATKATIKASNGETHEFNITVRSTANGNGWL